MFCHFGELLANLTLMERSWFLFSFSWGEGVVGLLLLLLYWDGDVQARHFATHLPKVDF
jgi:hypothetical protein